MIRRARWIWCVGVGALSALSAASSASGQGWDPWSEVVVHTDTYGVPHILADTEDALWFAAGYVYTDRMGRFQPYLARSVGGRMAEVLGPSALPNDIQTRLSRVREIAHERYPELPASDRRAMERYCQGVEAYRLEFPDRFPPQVEPCTAQDLMAALNLWVMEKAIRMARSRGEFPEGSNQWAVAPERTVDGRAIFSGNPHVPFDQPVIEMHLVGPDTNVYGMSLGLFAFSGANLRVAWSETTNFTDAADVYQVEFDPSDPTRYRYDEGWQLFRVRRETFRVRQPDGTLRDVEHTLRWTHHGPVTSFDERAGIALAVRTTQADQAFLFAQYREQMRARSVAEFQQALRFQARSTVNLACADIDGNIGYVWLGRAARRPSGFDFTKPVPGNTSQTEWGAFYPFEELPQVINPRSGFVQNCNNAPWLVTPSGEIGRDFPPELVPPSSPGRSGRCRRALEILEEPGRRFSVDDMRRMALDVKVVHGRETIDLLRAVLPESAKNQPEIAAVLELFEDWSGYATVDNRALYLLTVFGWRWTELEEGPDRVQRALEQAIEYASSHFGRIDVPWGTAHGVDRGGRWYPSGGAALQRGPAGSLISLHHGEPIRSGPDKLGRFPMEQGSSHVMVAQMTDPPRLWSAKPFGNSGDPSSPHYADLTELYAAGRLKPVWIERDDIVAHTESVLGRGVELPLPGGIGVVRSAADQLVELAVIPEGDGALRARIEEVADRSFMAELRLDDVEAFRILAADGTTIRDWSRYNPTAAPVAIDEPVVLEAKRATE